LEKGQQADSAMCRLELDAVPGQKGSCKIYGF